MNLFFILCSSMTLNVLTLNHCTRYFWKKKKCLNLIQLENLKKKLSEIFFTSSVVNVEQIFILESTAPTTNKINSGFQINSLTTLPLLT